MSNDVLMASSVVEVVNPIAPEEIPDWVRAMVATFLVDPAEFGRIAPDVFAVARRQRAGQLDRAGSWSAGPVGCHVVLTGDDLRAGGRRPGRST